MLGREKKPYALTSADFSLWQESEDTWGVRLKAQPTRTDLNLNDTGILRVNGTWQRAGVLGETPLNFSMEWDRPQLGQLTKLLSGVDQGWRGGAQLEVRLTGTPAKLMIASDTSIQDFRRYDITTGDALRLTAHCDAQYSSVDLAFSEILCSAPVADGFVSLKGSAGLPGAHTYDLLLNAERVPASALVSLVRRAKKNIPDDVITEGTLHGSVALERNPQLSKFRYEGRGEIENFRLTSAANKAEIGPETIPFVLTDRASSASFAATARLFHKRLPDIIFAAGPQVIVGPFSPGIGKLTAGGWIDRSGYEFVFAGESDTGKALSAARLAGVPALLTTATGQVQSKIEIHGGWAGLGSSPSNFSGPVVTGEAALRNVRIPLRGTENPIEVLAADLKLLPDSVNVEKLRAKVANSTWTGSLNLPRGCGTPAQCEIHFDLKSNQAAIVDLSDWVSPRPKDRPWYRMLEANGTTSSFFATLRATGRIASEHLQIYGVSATHVTAKLALDGGNLKIRDLTADVLGGKYFGQWETDFQAKPPISTSGGSFTGVSLDDVAKVMKDSWINGTASGSYQFIGKGSSVAELWNSAEASLHFEGRNGELEHIFLEDPDPIKFTRFAGVARLRAREIEIKDATLDGAQGSFQLTGTASPGRELQFKLQRAGAGSQGYAITGTLSEPHVSGITNAQQARLKR
jgi:AsmA-like C-terminal region